MRKIFLLSLNVSRCVVYGPWSLSSVFGLSVGVPGMRTENRPGSEMNFVQVSGITGTFGFGFGGAVVLEGLLGRRFVCSWALKGKLNARMMVVTAKTLFIGRG